MRVSGRYSPYSIIEQKHQKRPEFVRPLSLSPANKSRQVSETDKEIIAQNNDSASAEPLVASEGQDAPSPLYHTAWRTNNLYNQKTVPRSDKTALLDNNYKYKEVSQTA